MLVAVCSVKGAPGATTTAYALAAGWSSPALVIEADPLGGALALRLSSQSGGRLPAAPTVLGLTTAARSEGIAALDRSAHRVNGQVSVVPGFLMPERAAEVEWHPLAEALGGSPRPVVVDLGQLHSGSPVLPLAAAADVLVPVVRAEPESLLRLREAVPLWCVQLAPLRGRAPHLWPVLISSTRRADAELRELRVVLGDTTAAPFVDGAGSLAWDPAAVERLMSGEEPASWVGRSKLMRGARQLAGDLTGTLTERLTVAPANRAAAPTDRQPPTKVPATVHELLEGVRRG